MVRPANRLSRMALFSIALAVIIATWVIAAKADVPAGGPINVLDRKIGAKGDGQTDDTAAIQSAIDRYPSVYLPRGRYRINPRVGLVVKTGTKLSGDGPTQTFLVADPGGGSIQQLNGYGPGSIIRRAFNPAARNAYVIGVHITDLAIILTHPSDRVTTDAIQIGIDLRNISRSIVERVHVGNLPLPGSAVTRTTPRVFASQGYGIVLGTMSASDPAYAGGELNTLRDVSVWGGYKLITQDDMQLSPSSAVHAVVVDRCDLQNGHYLISQESKYTQAVTWLSCALQNVVPQAGSREPTYVIRIEGAFNRVDGGYIEPSTSVSYLAALGRTSYGNRIDFQFETGDMLGRVQDQGQNNVITLPGGSAGVRH